MNFLEKITKYYNELVNIAVIETIEKTKYQLKIPKRKKYEDVKWVLGIYVFIFAYILFVCQLAIRTESYYTTTRFIISIIIMILAIIAIVVKVNKKDDENLFVKLKRKVIEKEIYQSDFPSKLKPAHVRMLINNFEIDQISIIATLLDLREKKYIEIIENDKEIIFKKLSKKSDKLLEYEKFLMKWLIDKYGDGKKVTEFQICKAFSNNIYIERPYQLFNYFQYCVWTSFPLYKYYNKLKISTKLTYVLLIILSIFFYKYMWSIPLIIYGLISLTLLYPTMGLSNYGIEEKENWNEFKRFIMEALENSSILVETINENQMYLAYSTAMDIDLKGNIDNELKYIFTNDIYNNFLRDDKRINKELSLESDEKTILEPSDAIRTFEELVLSESKKYNLE